jgi:hypothetical protein
LSNRKKRSALRAAQPGYITLRRSTLPRLLSEPVAASPSLMPSTARWRIALDRAANLLQMVSEQMQAYSDGRCEDWHEGPGAHRFHENLELINELQAHVDDLRSDF